MIRRTLTVVAAVIFMLGCASNNTPDPQISAPDQVTNPTGVDSHNQTSSENDGAPNTGSAENSPVEETSFNIDHVPDVGDVSRMLAELIIEPEPVRNGYNRDLFPHWIDEDGDGCHTRAEVLIRDSHTNAQIDMYGCRVIAGDWHSLYDNTWHTSPADIEIDHVVALAEAWDSGAQHWDTERRQAFANDLTPGALRAVSSTSNQSKADKDPGQWRPPNQSAWCQYATDWISVKYRWQLTADPAEAAALADMLNTCGPSAPNPGDQMPVDTTAAPSPTTTVPATGADGCDGNYQTADGSCVPGIEHGDLNCGDLAPSQKPVKVTGRDVHRFDGDGDGWGCTS